MSEPILVTGAAGGSQGSTGRRITALLLERSIPVRAFVHKLDARSDALRELGAEVVRGDLLDPDSVRAALRGIKRAYFTYSVTDGLLEATTIFAMAAREVETELVVNNSQLQGARKAPSFRNMQHRLADHIFDWSEVGAVHLHAPPYYENLQALVRKSVAEQSAVFLPWGDGSASISLVGAEDVSRVAATLLAASETPSASSYDLIGAIPTVREIVDTLSTVLQYPIRYVGITDEQWVEAMRGHINPHALDHLSHLWRYFRSTERRSEEARDVTDTILTLTGSRAQTLEDFFRADRAEFGSVAAAI
ncbi:NAD(P)H-binding protein [Tunturiibacter gelidiferens]|uniref:NmrA family NAD(P)-binding protein n=1 Tax=Tunturiibacter gelidiferens TaxID=3069689 RepID=UPI003D9AD3F4